MTGIRHIQEAADVVRRGGVIAYPTEAVFGFGCDPLNPEAVGRILAIKNRSIRKGLILIAADLSQLEAFLEPLPHEVRARMLAEWPGPNTWVAPAADACPGWLTGDHAGLAVRVSDHPVVAAICRAAGSAIVSTSANRRGRPPARTAMACRRRFGSEVDLVVPGKTSGLGAPTRIRDALTGETIRAA